MTNTRRKLKHQEGKNEGKNDKEENILYVFISFKEGRMYQIKQGFKVTKLYLY